MRQTIKFLLLAFLTSCSSNNDNVHIKPISHKKSNTISHLQKIANHRATNSVLMLLPMSGNNKAIGEGIANAAMLADKQTDTEFYIIDTAEHVDTFRLYERFKGKNLKAVIGPVFYQEAQKYGALFQNVPILSLSNNLKINNGHIIACGVSPQNEIHKLMTFAKSRNMSGILAILPETTFGDLILSSLKNESTDDELEVVRYSEISKEDATRFARTSGKQIIFVIEPILITSKLKNANVFTLSSIALSNTTAWNDAIFAFSDNERQTLFATEYKANFGRKPNTIDIVAYDLVNAISESLRENISLFDTDFEGCLGTFSVNKKNGLERNFKILTIRDSDISEYSDERP